MNTAGPRGAEQHVVERRHGEPLHVEDVAVGAPASRAIPTGCSTRLNGTRSRERPKNARRQGVEDLARAGSRPAPAPRRSGTAT